MRLALIAYPASPAERRAAMTWTQRLKRILDQEPLHGEANSQLGHIHAIQSEPEKAEQFFTTVSKHRPKAAWLTFNQVLMHIQKIGVVECLTEADGGRWV